MTVNLVRLIFFDYFQNGHITGAWPSESARGGRCAARALVGATGGPRRGVVEISSGPIMPDTMEEIAARHGRRIFMSSAVALYYAVTAEADLESHGVRPESGLKTLGREETGLRI
jgi:hypothetical protein